MMLLRSSPPILDTCTRTENDIDNDFMCKGVKNYTKQLCYSCFATSCVFLVLIILSRSWQESVKSQPPSRFHVASRTKQGVKTWSENIFFQTTCLSWTRETDHFIPALITAFNNAPLISIPEGRKVISAVMPHVLGINFLESHHKESD